MAAPTDAPVTSAVEGRLGTEPDLESAEMLRAGRGDARSWTPALWDLETAEMQSLRSEPDLGTVEMQSSRSEPDLETAEMQSLRSEPDLAGGAC